MALNFKIFKYGQLHWLGCTELQIIEHNLAMTKILCYHQSSSDRVAQGLLTLTLPTPATSSSSGGAPAFPAVPCTHDSFQ